MTDMANDKIVSPKNQPSGHKTSLNCFICGNEYALKRIENHIFMCEQKWDAEQKLLKREDRKACPKAPPGFYNIIRRSMKHSRYESFVGEPEDKLEKALLPKEPKELNGPKEEESSFEASKRKPIEPYKKQEEDRATSPVVNHGMSSFVVAEKVDDQELESCPHCSRTFLPERLKIHLKSCKAGKPLKPRTQPKQMQQNKSHQRSIEQLTGEGENEANDNPHEGLIIPQQ